MGLVLEIPVCPLHGVPSDSRELLRALRHLSWEPHFDPHPTPNHCRPKTMARVAIADAALSHGAVQRARFQDCRALDALDGLPGPDWTLPPLSELSCLANNSLHHRFTWG